MSSPAPVASFALATYNRKDSLIEAVRLMLAQNVPVEVTVCDDGSTDGTPDAFAAAFPPAQHLNVRYFRFPRGNGPCVLRNIAAALSSAPIIFPIDDDSYLPAPTFVQEVLRDFDHPRVGAVAIPYINVRHSPKEWSRAPGTDQIYVTSEYLGAACALRRDLFTGVGGYIEEGFYSVEEWDMSLRLLDRGFVVRVGTSTPIHHQESPIRSSRFQTKTFAQNSIYIPARIVPTARLPIHLLGTSFNHIRHGFTQRDLSTRLLGLLKGLQLSMRDRALRRPVGPTAYRLMRLLRKRAVIPLAEIESQLPHVRPPAPMPVLTDPAHARAVMADRRLRWSTD